MKYIVPKSASLDVVNPQLAAAKIEVAEPVETIRDLILLMDNQKEMIIPISPKHLYLINQATSEYFVDMPNVLASIPGVIYDGQWMQQASSYPVIDWLVFSERIRKSGHTNFEPSEIKERSDSPGFTGQMDPDDGSYI